MAKWKLFRLCSGTTITASVLASVMVPFSLAEESMVRGFSYDDEWHYAGGTVHRPGTRNHRSLFCRFSFCADGYGSLGTDYGWSYSGHFVEGRMEGSGKLSNDFFKYVGGIKGGEPDGHGILKCRDGTYFEGTFVYGTMTGDFKLAPGDNAPTRRFKGEEADRNSTGPCEFP